MKKSLFWWGLGLVGLLAIGVPAGKAVFVPIAGIAPALIAAIPSIAGLIGSIFGRKTQKPTGYSAMQNPQQAQMYSRLLNMLQRKMGQQSPGLQPTNDALNMLYSTFYGRPYQPTANYGAGWAGVPPREASRPKPVGQ